MSKLSKLARAQRRARRLHEVTREVQRFGEGVDAGVLAAGVPPHELTDRHRRADTYREQALLDGLPCSFVLLNVVRIVQGKEPLSYRVARRVPVNRFVNRLTLKPIPEEQRGRCRSESSHESSEKLRPPRLMTGTAS